METPRLASHHTRRNSAPIMPERAFKPKPNLSVGSKVKSSHHRSPNSEPIVSQSYDLGSPITQHPVTEIPQTGNSRLMSPVSTPAIELGFPDINSPYTDISDTSATQSMFLEGNQTLGGFRGPGLKLLLRVTSATVSPMDRTRFMSVYIDITSDATIICADMDEELFRRDCYIAWRLSGIDFTLENISICERKDLPIKGIDGIFGSSFLRQFSYMSFKTVSEKYALPSRNSYAYPLLPPQNDQTLRVYTAIAVPSDLGMDSGGRPFVGIGVFFGQRVSLNTWIPYFLDDPVLQPKPGSVSTQYMWELAVFESFTAIMEAVLVKPSLAPFSRVEFYTTQEVLVSWWEIARQPPGWTRGLAGDFCPSPDRHIHFMNLRNKFAMNVSASEKDCFHILTYESDDAKRTQHEFAGQQAAILAELAITASRERIYSRDLYTKFLPKGHARVSKLEMRAAMNKIRLACKVGAKGIDRPQTIGTSSSKWATEKRKEGTLNFGALPGNKNNSTELGKDLESITSQMSLYQRVRKENQRGLGVTNDHKGAETSAGIIEKEKGAQKLLSILRSSKAAGAQYPAMVEPTIITEEAMFYETSHAARGEGAEREYSTGTAEKGTDITRLQVGRGYSSRIKRSAAQDISIPDTAYDHSNNFTQAVERVAGSVEMAENMKKRIEGGRYTHVGVPKTLLGTQYSLSKNIQGAKGPSPITEMTIQEKIDTRQAELQRQWAEAEARKIISQAQADANEMLLHAKDVWTQGINSQIMASAIANRIHSDAEAEAQKIKLGALEVAKNFEQQTVKIMDTTLGFNLMKPRQVDTEAVSDPVLEEAPSNSLLGLQAEGIMKYAEKVKRDAEEEAEKIWKDAQEIWRDAERIMYEANEMQRDTEAESEKARKGIEEIREWAEKLKNDAKAEAIKSMKDAEGIMAHASKIKVDAEAEARNIRRDAESICRVETIKTGKLLKQSEKIRRDAEIQAEKIKRDAETEAERLKLNAEAEARRIKNEAAQIWEEASKAKFDEENNREARKLKNDQESRDAVKRIKVEADKVLQQKTEVEGMIEKAETIKREAELMKRDAEVMKMDAELMKQNAEIMEKDAKSMKMDAEAAMEKATAAAGQIIAEAHRMKKEAENAKNRAVTISEKIKAESKDEAKKIKAYAEKVLKEAERQKRDMEAKAKKIIEESEQIRKDNEAEYKRREEEWDTKLKLEMNILEESVLQMNSQKNMIKDSILRMDSQKKKVDEGAQEIVSKAKEEASRIIQEALKVEDNYPVCGDVLGSAAPITPESFYKMFLEPTNGTNNIPLSPLEFIDVLENSKTEITLGQIVNHCPEAAKRFIDQCKGEERLVHNIELYTSQLDGRLKFRKGERLIPYEAAKGG